MITDQAACNNEAHCSNREHCMTIDDTAEFYFVCWEPEHVTVVQGNNISLVKLLKEVYYFGYITF